MLRTGELPSTFSKEMVIAFGYWFVPMFGWITCMILVALSKDTLGVLIFFLLFLHPAVTLPFGILNRTLKRLVKKYFNAFGVGTKWRKIFVRYFTLSPINFFTLIALGQLIMYFSWQRSSSCKISTLKSTTHSFNQCGNSTSTDDFGKVQDFLSKLFNDNIDWYILIALFVFPLVFHLIESLCVEYDPIPICDFFLAKDLDNVPPNDIELQDFGLEVSENPSPPEIYSFRLYEIACCLLSILYLILIFIIPKLVIEDFTILDIKRQITHPTDLLNGLENYFC